MIGQESSAERVIGQESCAKRVIGQESSARRVIGQESSAEVEQVWRHLSHTAQGCFAPLCAFIGGVVAQEALKALTGKFTPLQQWVREPPRPLWDLSSAPPAAGEGTHPHNPSGT